MYVLDIAATIVGGHEAGTVGKQLRMRRVGRDNPDSRRAAYGTWTPISASDAWILHLCALFVHVIDVADVANRVLHRRVQSFHLGYGVKG